MTIAVKYCGGCNPRFDRTEIYRRLMSDFPGHTILAGPGEGTPDIAAVVCGCPSQCASHGAFSGRFGKIVLYAPEQYGDLCRLILENDKE